jgi:hypothetical protein
MDNLASSEDPARASVRVIESAVALARAEAKLAISEARAAASRAGVALVLGWAGVCLLQVAIVMVSLSPALLALRPWPVVLLMVLPSVVLAVAALLGAFLKFRSLMPSSNKHSDKSDNLVSKEVRA